MWLRWLYLLGISLLVAHEIDSAYWMEWQLFDLPGGIAGFFTIHIPLVALLVWGYERVCAEARAGLWLALATSTLGLFAVGAHTTFLIAGRTEFRQPGSLILLGAVAVTCGALLPVTMHQLRPANPPRPVASDSTVSSPRGGDPAGQPLREPMIEPTDAFPNPYATEWDR